MLDIFYLSQFFRNEIGYRLFTQKSCLVELKCGVKFLEEIEVVVSQYYDEIVCWLKLRLRFLEESRCG